MHNMQLMSEDSQWVSIASPLKPSLPVIARGISALEWDTDESVKHASSAGIRPARQFCSFEG